MDNNWCAKKDSGKIVNNGDVCKLREELRKENNSHKNDKYIHLWGIRIKEKSPKDKNTAERYWTMVKIKIGKHLP